MQHVLVIPGHAVPTQPPLVAEPVEIPLLARTIWAVFIWLARHPGTVQCVIMLVLLFMLIAVASAPTIWGDIPEPRPSGE